MRHPKHKGAHHKGGYQRKAHRIRQAANANPHTRCWRCGRPLQEHPPHKNGRPAYWTAGHLIDGDPQSPLAPEASTCNFAAGARHGNHTRTTRSEDPYH